MNINEKGIEKEVEVSNFFSNLGYFTRTHIQLYPREGKISDIDVLCIKFDNQLVERRNIIEVKKSNDSYSAIFQLYGLKTYFGNCDALFVSDKVSIRTLKITKDLGIKVYSFKTLNKITEQDPILKSLDYEASYLSFNKLNKITEEDTILKSTDLKTSHLFKIHNVFLKRIKELNSDIFWGYNEIWLERDPYIKLYKIQSLFKLTEDLSKSNIEDEALSWIRKELFMLSFVSIYEIASDCMELGSNLINEYIEEKYYNLGMTKEKKIQLKDGVDKLVRLFEEKEGVKLDIKFEIIPEWVPTLSNCVKKIISTAAYAQKNLLLNEIVFKSFLLGSLISIREITKNGAQLDVITKINTDILKILHKQHIKLDFNNFI